MAGFPGGGLHRSGGHGVERSAAGAHCDAGRTVGVWDGDSEDGCRS